MCQMAPARVGVAQRSAPPAAKSEFETNKSKLNRQQSASATVYTSVWCPPVGATKMMEAGDTAVAATPVLAGRRRSGSISSSGLMSALISLVGQRLLSLHWLRALGVERAGVESAETSKLCRVCGQPSPLPLFHSVCVSSVLVSLALQPMDLPCAGRQLDNSAFALSTFNATKGEPSRDSIGRRRVVGVDAPDKWPVKTRAQWTASH